MPSEQCFELCLEGIGRPFHYVAYVTGDSGEKVAQHGFEWREDQVSTALTLGQIARSVVSSQPPEQAAHEDLGKRLFQAAFGGQVGVLWAQRRRAARRKPLNLVLRINPQNARTLAQLPWEYLYDGEAFLSLDWRTSISRVPWGVEIEPGEPLNETLRMLVVIAAPRGLNENQILDTAKEEDLILEATMAAQNKGELEIVFAPNGSLETLKDYLIEYDPHILHFVGHGVFDATMDCGFLLMEAAGGEKRLVNNQQFASFLVKETRSLRCVFLSACESARVADTSAFASLGEFLVEQGIPAVLAMQYSVYNRSAMAFSSAYYKGLQSNRPLPEVVAIAREAMLEASPNKVDFGTPTLYLSDPGCLFVDRQTACQVTSHPIELTNVPVTEHFVGRASYLRELQTHLDPENGDWRAAIIYGLGGMGKTALVARLSTRMATRLDGVKAIRVQPATTAKDILDQVAGFLLVNNAVFNRPVIAQLNAVKDQAVPLDNKAGLLVQILNELKLLLILDNYEDVLEGGQVVSQKAQAASVQGETKAVDPDLPRLIQLLIEGVNHSSKLVFTSRVDFSPIDEKRQPGIVGHLSLEELPFTEAAYLMEARPPLDQLPISGGLSKRSIYGQVGGHPYTLDLLSKHAERRSLEEVLAGTTGLKGELLAFTLLEGAIGQLSARARELLRRGAVYRQAVAEEGLAYLVGNEQDVMPDVGEEVQELVNWGLVVKLPGEGSYIVPAIVQRWAEGQWAEEERRELLCKAAGYWLRVSKESHSIEPELNAREYLFAAGEYEAADEIVNRFTVLFLRWGQYELLIRLLEQSVETILGGLQADAIHNLAIVYHSMGDYVRAYQLYTEVLKTMEELGNCSGVARTLHQLGVLAQNQGTHEQARQLYTKALRIKRELGDHSGATVTLYQLGSLAHAKGDYEQARHAYTQVLEEFEELENYSGMASTLHQLGILAQDQSRYIQARQMYMQALKIKEKLGDRSGTASTLYQLGMLALDQRDYNQALQLYTQALKIREELGNRTEVAKTLHGLGNLAYLQGEYSRARQLYTQVLTMMEELGNHSGVAATLEQLGMLAQAQGDNERARHLYTQVLMIMEEQGDRSGMAITLHQLGILTQRQGDDPHARVLYEQAKKLFEELGNRSGVACQLHQLGIVAQRQGDNPQARVMYEHAKKVFEEIGDWSGVAKTLHQLGMLAEDQGDYSQARLLYEQSLKIEEDLGDRLGVASTLGQLGLLVEAQGDFDGAVRFTARGLIIFEQLSAPERNLALQTLSRLQEKMGAEAFEAALREIGVEYRPGQEQEEQSPDHLQILFGNTYAVLRQIPEKRAEWWNGLRKLQSDLQGQNQSDLSTMVGVLIHLVEGAKPESLNGQVPEAYQEMWGSFLQALLQGDENNE